MRRHTRFMSLLILGAAFPCSSQAQKDLVLDLAQQPAGSPVVESVRPGTYGVQIDNRVSRLRYKVTVLVRNVLMPALPIDSSVGPLGMAPSPCSPVEKAGRVLTAAHLGRSESEVGRAVDAAKLLLKTDNCALEKEELNHLIDDSRIRWLSDVVMGKGQEVVVTVERLAQDSAPAKTWEKTFTTGPRGQWRTTYGFAAAFTRVGTASGVFAKRNSYFLQTTDSVTAIAERKDRGAADLVPVVLFHFMPADGEARSWVYGPNAGISFDGTNPTALVGWGTTYEQNVNLSVGFMGRREPILLPKYDIGHVVPADLTESQLTEMKLRIRPYVVLTFRLSGSPFSSSDKPKEKAKEAEKPESNKK
jgi:hypothetical protein